MLLARPESFIFQFLKSFESLQIWFGGQKSGKLVVDDCLGSSMLINAWFKSHCGKISLKIVSKQHLTDSKPDQTKYMPKTRVSTI